MRETRPAPVCAQIFFSLMLITLSICVPDTSIAGVNNIDSYMYDGTEPFSSGSTNIFIAIVGVIFLLVIGYALLVGLIEIIEDTVISALEFLFPYKIEQAKELKRKNRSYTGRLDFSESKPRFRGLTVGLIVVAYASVPVFIDRLYGEYIIGSLFGLLFVYMAFAVTGSPLIRVPKEQDED